MDVLLTGFGPFGENRVNPSQLVIERLGGVILPVSAERTPRALGAAVEQRGPDAVLMLGLAERREEIQIERLAVNLLDFRLPDNDGKQPVDQPIEPDGPPAYFSNVPVKAIVAAWQEAGIPGSLSNSAGTFCCNQALYVALHRGLRAGFVHVPPLSKVSLDVMIRAVEIARDLIAAPAPLPR